jgi:hypothetical protein
MTRSRRLSASSMPPRLLYLRDMCPVPGDNLVKSTKRQADSQEGFVQATPSTVRTASRGSSWPMPKGRRMTVAAPALVVSQPLLGCRLLRGSVAPSPDLARSPREGRSTTRRACYLTRACKSTGRRARRSSRRHYL